MDSAMIGTESSGCYKDPDRLDTDDDVDGFLNV
ncbi:MAG: hypothetical protein QOF58_2502 [Pseudonocardiales bacterium]|jgi:hypothetical protein|nr:hypothetical protein [Pseudonocardiales bacterium]